MKNYFSNHSTLYSQQNYAMIRNIERIVLLLVLLCFGMGARAGNVLTIGSAQGAPGEEVELALALENTDAVAALQVSIPLGEQLNYVEGSAAMTDRSNGHSVTAGVKDGTLNVMVYSMGMSALTGNTGDVVTLRLKLGNQPTDVTLTASKLVMTDGSGNAIGDATSASGVVSIRCAKAEYSPMTIDFGRVPIRSTYEQNFTVYNTGNETLEVTGLQFSNYLTKFSSTTQFPLTVAPGSSASINITYAPEERGTVSEEVKVLCNSISKLNTIALKAQPFAVNELHVQPVSGIADEVVTIPLTMNNMDAISGLQLEFQLPDALEYVENSFQLSGRKTNHVTVVTCKNGLLKILAYSPNDAAFTGEEGEIGSFQVKLVGRYDVELTPTKTVLSATINNKVENVCSEVYGAVVSIQSPSINADESFYMGAVSVTEPCERTFNIRNYGSAPLTVSRIVFDNENLSIKESLPININPWESFDVTVVYSSTEQTTFTGTMQIYSNDPEQRVWNVSVTGSRFAPNYFSIATPDVSAFENMKVEVAVNTYDPIVGLQFDLTYPGQYYEPFDGNYTLESRAEGLTVTYRQIDNNTLRFFCYFLTGSGIAAGDGKVMTIEMKPKGEYVPGGEYTAGVKEIKLGTSEMANKYAGVDSESTFTVFYPVTSISIEPSPAALDKGQTLALVATVNEDATNKNVTWSSADESIVSVDAEGVVTGVEYGTTTITVTSESNPEVAATCEVTVVYVPVTSISISQTTATLEGGETVKLIAKVNEDASNKKIIWTSADSNVASVRADGTVTGLHQGTTIITGTSEANPELSVTCEVTVTSDYEMPQSGWLMPWGRDEAWEMKYNEIEYSMEPGNTDWAQPGFDDSSWGTLTGPMGSYEPYNFYWDTDYNGYQLRREFFVPSVDEDIIFTFYAIHDDDLWVYLNGEQVGYFDGASTSERSIVIPADKFVRGMNLLALRIVDGCCDDYLDYALYMKAPKVGTKVQLPDAPFEFYYNAADYDEEEKLIPNHPDANLKGASLVLSENIPQWIDNELLRINDLCWGSIDRWDMNSTASGEHFYRSGEDCLTMVCKVTPNYGNGGNASDFISNREWDYNYMWRIGDHGRMFLHTGDAYDESRSMSIPDNEPQVLAVRVDGKNNYIQLDNLTTGESLRVNQVNWGGGGNVFRLFRSNDSGEYFKGDFYWVYYSFELLTDEQMRVFTDNFLLGDVNGDRQITPTDATMILMYYFNIPQTGFIIRAADVTQDGNISPADSIEDLLIYFGSAAGAKQAPAFELDEEVIMKDPE